MRAKRRTDVIEVPFPPVEAEAEAPSPPESLDELKLRRERIVYDGITNLPIHPFETPERVDERIENLGVIYLQVGKFFGFEELFGWESYDRVLAIGLRRTAGRRRAHRASRPTSGRSASPARTGSSSSTTCRPRDAGALPSTSRKKRPGSAPASSAASARLTTVRRPTS